MNAEPTDPPKPVRNWLVRWSDLIGWLPLMIALAAVGWLVFGAMDTRDDLMRVLLTLPVISAYAVAAAGLSYLVWRRWSIRLDQQQLDAYWTALMAGDKGAFRVFLVNAIFYLCALFAFLYFFLPPR